MKLPKIIAFYPNDQEKRLNPVVYEGAVVVSLPFDHILTEEYLNKHQTLIAIWDSTSTESGIAKLDEIKRAFPEVPLLLVAKDPSKKYLMAALKYKVDRLLTLPLQGSELQEAISGICQINSHTSVVTRLGTWFQSLQVMAYSLVKSISNKAYSSGELGSLETLGVAPYSSLPFFNKKLEQESTSDINVQFLGNLNIKIRGNRVPEITGKKNATVLAYLLFHHYKSIHKDILMDKFWSDVTPSSARNSLNVAICSIRKSLQQAYKDQEVILYSSENYCINPDLEVITDVDKFIYFWKKGRAIESTQGLGDALGAYNRAVYLYKEEFLDNIRFDEWCESERDNLREIYLFILNRLSAYSFDLKNYDACISICRKMLDKDDCLEDIHRKLMTCYYALDLTDMALKQYFKCEKALEKELNLKPSEPTRELFQKIKNGKTVML